MPNNDIAMVRKKRIQKAQEYGAVWAREWSAAVSHVVVDESLLLSDVRKAIGSDQLKVILRIPTFPGLRVLTGCQPYHVIVKETYPPECIRFQALLPIDLSRFQVANDVLQPGSEAQKQDLPAKSQNPASTISISSATSETADVAVEHHDKRTRPLDVRSESIRFDCAEEIEENVRVADSKWQDFDGLDEIVAKVKEMIDLVSMVFVCLFHRFTD